MKKYARVMHHIGGLTGANDNADMIRGGEDELNLITEQDVPPGTDVERLFKLGALREATPDEVKRFEVSKGLRDPEDEDSFTTFTTGSAGLKPGDDNAGAATGKDKGKLVDADSGKGANEALQDKQQAAGDAAAGSQGHQETTGSFNGMSKGELSEFTVPELKNFAKDAGIEGYGEMKKDELLDALTGQQAAQ